MDLVNSFPDWDVVMELAHPRSFDKARARRSLDGELFGQNGRTAAGVIRVRMPVTPLNIVERLAVIPGQHAELSRNDHTRASVPNFVSELGRGALAGDPSQR